MMTRRICLALLIPAVAFVVGCGGGGGAGGDEEPVVTLRVRPNPAPFIGGTVRIHGAAYDEESGNFDVTIRVTAPDGAEQRPTVVRTGGGSGYETAITVPANLTTSRLRYAVNLVATHATLDDEARDSWLTVEAVEAPPVIDDNTATGNPGGEDIELPVPDLD